MTSTISPPIKQRIASIDILRGLVMVIMAIDHIRDGMHKGHPEPTDLTVTTPILFFTRWITHFCAPTFVFLSGISARLAGTRRSPHEQSLFLYKRGLWLLFVEVVVISLGITFNPIYNFIILQVIWAIGASMILLGLLLALRATPRVIGIIGAIIFFGHNLIDVYQPGAIAKTAAWHLLVSYRGFNPLVALGHQHYVLPAYALLPWTGVMFVGYAAGTMYLPDFDALRRRKLLLYMGCGMLAFFFLFRAFNWYGDPEPWSQQKTMALTVISFFNVTKYPCSLLYLCMTLGVAQVILSCTENVKGRWASILTIYGSVPFFYYVCHWYLIRIVGLILFFAMGFTTHQIITPNSPFLFEPPAMGVSLGGIYLIWILVVASLYWPCRWFSRYKKTHRQWWLSYL